MKLLILTTVLSFPFAGMTFAQDVDEADCDNRLLERDTQGRCVEKPANKERCTRGQYRTSTDICEAITESMRLDWRAKIDSPEGTREVAPPAAAVPIPTPVTVTTPSVVKSGEAPASSPEAGRIAVSPPTPAQVRTPAADSEPPEETDKVAETPAPDTEAASESAVSAQESIEDLRSNYKSDTCKWVEDMPRKVHSAPGCGRGGVQVCVGYVVCDQNNSEAKFVRTATCRAERCGEDDVVSCVNDNLYSSVKAKDEDRNYMSERFMNLLSPGATRR